MVLDATVLQTALLFAALAAVMTAVAIVVAYRHHGHHKPRREFVLDADEARARVMADFYLHVHGAEW